MELSTVFVFSCVESTKYNLEIDFRGCYRTATACNIRVTTLYKPQGNLFLLCCITCVSRRNNNC